MMPPLSGAVYLLLRSNFGLLLQARLGGFLEASGQPWPEQGLEDSADGWADPDGLLLCSPKGFFSFKAL